MKNFQFAVALFIAVIGSSFTFSSVQPDTKSMAAVDYFLKLDGIDGESTSHGLIEIDSLTWGANRTSVKIIRFCTPTVSPAIQRLAAEGKRVQGVLYEKRSDGTEFRYELKDVVVSSYQTYSAKSRPTETFSLNFPKPKF
jgi:type VI secretion system secreted protein Hcp